MSAADFNELLKRYLNDTLSTDELQQLMAWLQQHQNTEVLKQAIEQALRDRSFAELSDSSRADLIFQKILKQAEEGPPLAQKETRPKYLMWFKWAAAAAVIIAIGIYYSAPKEQPAATVQTTTPVTPDVAPGGNKAILQLADGSTITLDDAASGLLCQQGNTKVEKLDNGRLAYNATAQPNAEILYNTIITPRGGQYHIILPDGSKVWLNAASSLRFPTSFAGEERTVELTGEAYFEVAKDARKPFRMNVNAKATIEVLGTHFNVNAYDNEQSLNTTLLEGSIKVISNQSAILKPGQQAVIAKELTIHNEVDLDHVLAWKNGLFQFNSDNIQTIMRQIERWYDVDVYYKGPIPDGHYSGIVPRANNLQKVLRILEESDLKFTLQGKKLLVL